MLLLFQAQTDLLVHCREEEKRTLQQEWKNSHSQKSHRDDFGMTWTQTSKSSVLQSLHQCYHNKVNLQVPGDCCQMKSRRHKGWPHLQSMQSERELQFENWKSLYFSSVFSVSITNDFMAGI